MKSFRLLILLLTIGHICKCQTATFITISSGGQFDRVTIGASGCTSTTLNLCGNLTGSALSIALDGNILYIVDNKGFLYKNTLTNSGTVGNCTKLGQFANATTGYYGLTVGNGGIVYTAFGSTLESYNPSTNVFSVLGSLPNGWVIGGDLLFYKGTLYEAANTTSGTNILVQVNLTNISASTLYMNFNAGSNVFGFASVTVPCSDNQAYAVSTSGSSTNIYAVDMANKTQAATAKCTLPFKVNDAASIAETQSTTPPSNPIITSPFNICQGDIINFPTPIVGSIKDTLRWYTQASGGSSYGKPTPKIDSSVLGTTTYYVSAFDTSTGCETARQTMIVSVNPYPAVPTIAPKDSAVFCVGSNATLTSSAATGNQWNFNGSALVGATNVTYSTNIVGNYSVTTTSSKGCSKTSAITKVVITDTIKSFASLAVCINQMPYSWNGLIFNSAGTQTKVGLKTIVGCDSSATLVLSITDTVKSNFSKTICNSDLPYTWGGVVFNNAGTQVKYFKTLAGCDSVVTMFLSVQTPTTVTSFFYDCKKVIYKGNTYTVSTVVSDTIKSSMGCDSILNVANIVITPVTPITNTVKLESCKSIIYKGNTYAVSTIVGDTIKSYQGCDSIYNVANIVITPITPITYTTNFFNCKSITYNSNTYTISTVIRDTMKSQQGCDSVYSIVSIIITPITAFSNTINLSGCKSVVYKSNIYTSSTIINDTIKSLNGGCDSVYNIVNIAINPITPINTSSSYVDCKEFIFNGVKYTVSTIIKDTLKSYQGCDSVYNTATITITPIVAVDNIINLKHCNRITYNGIDYYNSVVLKDTIKNAKGCDSVYNTVNITITPIITTTLSKYYSSCDSIVYLGKAFYNSAIIKDTIKSIGGCDSIYTQTSINIFKKPTIDFSTNIIYTLANNAVILKPTVTDAIDFSWFPSIYLDDATVEFPICTPAKDTTYKLVVLSDSGCRDSSYLKVFVSRPLKIPTAFSPNGDGINDTWEIEYLNTYPQNTVQIFNRWGQVLFTSFAGNYKPWNGKYNGKDLPVGIYYYIIKLSPTLALKSGYITLLK